MNNNYILSLDFTNHKIVLQDLTGKELDTISYEGGAGGNISVVLSNMDGDVCYGVIYNNGVSNNSPLFLKISNNHIVSSKQVTVTSNNLRYITAARNNPRLFAIEVQRGFNLCVTFIIIDDNFNIISTFKNEIAYNEISGKVSYGYFTNNDEYFISEHNYSSNGSGMSRTDVIKLVTSDTNTDIVSATRLNGIKDNNASVFNSDLSICVHNNTLYNISVENNSVVYDEGVSISPTGMILVIINNDLYTVQDNKLYVYSISSTGITLKTQFNLNANYNWLRVRWNPNDYMGFFSGVYMDFTNLGNTEVLTSMFAKGVTLYNPYDANAESNDVLQDKTAYNISGKIVGTMPNNGELNYEVSTSEQIIPEGYTTGGTIEAARQTNEDYDGCLEITNYILAGGVRYQPLEYIQSNMNQYLDTGISLFNYDTWEIEMEIMLSSLYNHQHLVSVLPDNENYEFWIYDSGQFSFKYADYTRIDTNITLQANIKYILKLVYNGSQIVVYLNNEEKASYNRSGKISNALKFGHREGDTSYFSGNLYSLIFKGDNNTILNGTPTKDIATGEVGLFDTITNTFFTSAGTLNYVAGPTLGGEE